MHPQTAGDAERQCFADHGDVVEPSGENRATSRASVGTSSSGNAESTTTPYPDRAPSASIRTTAKPPPTLWAWLLAHLDMLPQHHIDGHVQLASPYDGQGWMPHPWASWPSLGWEGSALWLPPMIGIPIDIPKP
jgi:hypothetical protein